MENKKEEIKKMFRELNTEDKISLIGDLIGEDTFKGEELKQIKIEVNNALMNRSDLK